MRGTTKALGPWIFALAIGCSGKPTTTISANQAGPNGFGTPGTSAPNGTAGVSTILPSVAGRTGGAGGTPGGAAGVSAGAAGARSGGGPLGGGAGASSGGTTPTGSGATFTQVYGILMVNCAGSSCHVGANRPGGGLSMADKATAYMNLVGVASRNCRGQQRVVPGMPTASVLVQALQHSGGCAPSMPQGKPALSANDINTIIAWITAGAMNN